MRAVFRHAAGDAEVTPPSASSRPRRRPWSLLPAGSRDQDRAVAGRWAGRILHSLVERGKLVPIPALGVVLGGLDREITQTIRWGSGPWRAQEETFHRVYAGRSLSVPGFGGAGKGVVRDLVNAPPCEEHGEGTDRLLNK